MTDLDPCRNDDRPVRVETAISDLSRADAQIGNADYRFIKSPLTGQAEMPPHR